MIRGILLMENKVELLGYYGSDEVIACSAWTSTSRNLTDEKRARIQRLIEMLWINGHETPFEKGVVHFLVDTDIASHIHLLKHRISSLNAESARYKELKEDKYYLPEDWGETPSSDCIMTPGISNNPLNNYESEDFAEEGEDWLTILERYTILGNRLYHQCIADLEPVLGRKRAKESARFFKTYNSQIQADIMFNMRSFANFIKLRNHPAAQKEIREIAQQMWDLVATIEGEPFKYTLQAIWNRCK
jgi:flavin-dependent thymidylate synthase